MLLNGMVYSNDELAALEDELDSVPDRPEALHPSQTHVASKHAVTEGCAVSFGEVVLLVTC